MFVFLFSNITDNQRTISFAASYVLSLAINKPYTKKIIQYFYPSKPQRD